MGNWCTAPVVARSAAPRPPDGPYESNSRVTRLYAPPSPPGLRGDSTGNTATARPGPLSSFVRCVAMAQGDEEAVGYRLQF